MVDRRISYLEKRESEPKRQIKGRSKRMKKKYIHQFKYMGLNNIFWKLIQFALEADEEYLVTNKRRVRGWLTAHKLQKYCSK